MPSTLEILTALAVTIGLGLIAYLYKKFQHPILDPDRYIPIKLIQKTVVSDNKEKPTVFLVFDSNVKDFPTGAHVSCKFEEAGKTVIRPYTPTRFSESECELMIRVYAKGAMTQHMYQMKVGDTLLFKGPTGLKRYGLAGPGSLSKMLKSGAKHQKHLKHILMLAGGTGITPMLQICNDIIRNEDDHTKATLLVANSTPKDVMLYEELIRLETRSQKQIRVHLTVSRTDGDSKWSHLTGRVDQAMLKRIAPSPSNDVACAVCGPTGFDKAVAQVLEEMGHEKKMIWRW
mmetsp:Transcript_23738/g.33191  ORF Transcript_23738/g.33191 Transcript_23738/m.33191 type:complete len:288 (+) Transcript_23738:146-1009(+)|eukprot:CAMPEP_0184478412 /NCGR_PEP_ID=MMETSP0113_2-20130426/451_1 /TAXON_ID=91329 /ORGANISM="Norrisiella sphaerica, Strain BC52" /LENGTH=287 /DNA_ID=CAMNT_0026856195 /DNA_START=134 /DNA_END=994 /DNA_ORIENTATION=-